MSNTTKTFTRTSALLKQLEEFKANPNSLRPALSPAERRAWLSISRPTLTPIPTKFKLRMLTKEECQLCDEAKHTIETELSEPLKRMLVLEEVDITEDGNEELFDRWRYEIPVFYLDGKYLCRNRIDMVKLRARLEMRRQNK